MEEESPFDRCSSEYHPRSCIYHLLKQVLQLPDVPFRLLAATAKDGYRKPIPGMWYELERIFADENVTIGAHIISPSATLPMTLRFHRQGCFVFHRGRGGAERRSRRHRQEMGVERRDPLLHTRGAHTHNTRPLFFHPPSPHTLQEYFLKLKAAPYTLQGFHPSTVPTNRKPPPPFSHLP